MAAPPLERKLVFLHVPKCGGTSIDAFIGACYPEEARARMSAAAALRAADLEGVSEQRFSQRLLPYFLAQRRLRYVSGHFSFSDEAYRAFCREWEFLTILRHPVERWFSHYFFNRYKPGDHYAIREDLAEFVGLPRALRVAHAIVTQLGGRSLEEVLARPDEGVAAACATLDKLALVGCLEHLDEFVRQFAARYGPTLRVPELQRNPAPPSAQAEQVTEAIRRRVEGMCRLDLEVYRYALGRAAGTAAAQGHGG
jgi:hypothetical protein